MLILFHAEPAVRQPLLDLHGIMRERSPGRSIVDPSPTCSDIPPVGMIAPATKPNSGQSRQREAVGETISPPVRVAAGNEDGDTIAVIKAANRAVSAGRLNPGASWATSPAY